MTQQVPRVFRALGWLLTVLVPVILVLGSIRLVMSRPALSLIYHLPGFPADPYGFSREDRLRLAPGAVDYLVFQQSDDALRTQQASEGNPLYTEREISHLRDVQIVTNWGMAALVASLAIAGGISILLFRQPTGRQLWWWAVARGGGLMLLLLALLLAYILVDWTHFFDTFHALFFAEGTWRFYYSDSLIRLFPIAFWQIAALAVGGLSALGGLAGLGAGLLAGRRTRVSHRAS